MVVELLPQNKKIILFDGVCNMCDRAVQYIIRNDRRDIFRFAALDSEVGQQIIAHLKIDSEKIDSIILYAPGLAYFTKSDAAIEIAMELGGLLKVAYVFKVIPLFVRDRIYDYIAKNRYRWFGRKSECMIPSENIKAKFL
jgi:predicted DCC family thiol-disulfide oxidoreductase YuxK